MGKKKVSDGIPAPLWELRTQVYNYHEEEMCFLGSSGPAMKKRRKRRQEQMKDLILEFYEEYFEDGKDIFEVAEEVLHKEWPVVGSNHDRSGGRGEDPK